MSADYLEIFLDDHRAVMAAMVQLSGRVLRNNRSTTWEPALRELHKAIEEDAGMLNRISEALDMDGGSLKRAAALVGERAARLKLNGHILSYSPLSRLVELESLMAALEFKRNMWASLERLIGGRPVSKVFDWDTMDERSMSQQEMVRPILDWAAAELAAD